MLDRQAGRTPRLKAAQNSAPTCRDISSAGDGPASVHPAGEGVAQPGGCVAVRCVPLMRTAVRPPISYRDRSGVRAVEPAGSYRVDEVAPRPGVKPEHRPAPIL